LSGCYNRGAGTQSTEFRLDEVQCTVSAATPVSDTAAGVLTIPIMIIVLWYMF